MNISELKRLLRVLKPLTVDVTFRKEIEAFLSKVVRPTLTHETEIKLIDSYLKDLKAVPAEKTGDVSGKKADTTLVRKASKIIGRFILMLIKHKLADETLKEIIHLLGNL